MSGWTARPRKAANGCFGCGQERGAVVQALSARISRLGTLWLCTGCAASEQQRRAFVDEYAQRTGLLAATHRRSDAPS